MGIHAQKSGDGTPVDQLFEYVHQGYRVLGFWPIPLLYDILSSLEMATLLFSIFELSNIDWHFLRCVVQRPTQLILWDGWLCRTHAFQSFVCCFSRIQFPSPYNIILPHLGGGLPHVCFTFWPIHPNHHWRSQNGQAGRTRGRPAGVPRWKTLLSIQCLTLKIAHL